MVTKEELEATFRKVGNDFGFVTVTAEYAPFRDLKVKWCRTYESVSFTVSDYLRDAPVDVIEDIAGCIMGRMRGEEINGYEERTKKWLTSHEYES